MAFPNSKQYCQIGLVVVLLLFAFFSCDSGSKKKAVNNALTDTEIENGWILLFDGKNISEWHGFTKDSIPEGIWIVQDEAIKRINPAKGPQLPNGKPVRGGDLFSTNAYENFEFRFEWKIASGSNSGIKYNVSKELSLSRSYRSALGWEYQIIDDENYASDLKPVHRTAALYDMMEAKNSILKPVGEYNSSRIVFNGNHGEHWINGQKVLEYETDSSEFDSLFALSKYKKIKGFREKKTSHIVLQDHGDEVWFRNLKIKIFF
jgi:hypothetical protein